MAAMAVDSRQQLSGMPYDTMRYQTPQFTNPWAAVSGTAQGQLYATSMNHAVAPDQARHSMNMGAQQPTASTMAYPTSSLPALSMASGAQHMADPSIYMGQDSPLQGYAAARPYGADYSMPAGTTAGSYGPSVPAPYAAPGYMPVDQTKLAPFGTMHDRRSSHPSVVSNSFLSSPADAMRYRQSSLIDMDNRMQSATDAERNSFSDALDASRGMVAMSQDITPRNIYGNQGSARSSTDSYGFPSSHSSHSSISSASTYPSYYGGSSVSEASYGDYSSASESVDIPSRRLPRPRVGSGSGSGGSTVPPAPQSMMSQFSSKVSSSSQKKHKCKVCDKRFTRPSSLQTHMYSHTGEKPFACDVDGCGRHFSVVSNLRRHKKVHKGEGDHLSPDDDE